MAGKFLAPAIAEKAHHPARQAEAEDDCSAHADQGVETEHQGDEEGDDAQHAADDPEGRYLGRQAGLFQAGSQADPRLALGPLGLLELLHDLFAARFGRIGLGRLSGRRIVLFGPAEGLGPLDGGFRGVAPADKGPAQSADGDEGQNRREDRKHSPYSAASRASASSRSSP